MIEILHWLQFRCDEMVELLSRFTNAASPSTDKLSIDKFSRMVASEWRAIGGNITMFPQVDYGDHMLVEWGSGNETILVLCHMDTVWSVKETSERPFRVEDGKAYGPGVYDMKAGIVQTLFAIKALSYMGLNPAKKIAILHTSDEEIGSPSSRQIIEREAKKASAVFVLEPAEGIDGALKTWRKGVGRFKISITGRASHAGADYEKGVCAITEAARQILYLHGLSDLELGTTVSVGVVKAGTRSNVIAEHAELDLDLRVTTTKAADKIVSRIKALKPFDTRIRLLVEGGLNRPPMERSKKNLELFKIAQTVGYELGMNLEEKGTGGGSDGNFTAALGIPTLDGLGAVGDDAHAVTEYVFVSSLPERAAILAGLMLKV